MDRVHSGAFKALEPPRKLRLGANGRVAVFVVASVLGHTGLSAALPAHIPTAPPPEPEPIAFAVMLDEPEPEPIVEVEPEPEPPEPEPVVRPVVREETPEPEPQEEVAAEEPETEVTEEPLGDPNALPDANDPQGEAQATLSHTASHGLNVGLPAGSGNEGAQRGTLRHGSASPAPRPSIDRRALVRRYLREVQRSLGAPTQTRALRRAGLEGVVMVSLRIDPEGHVRGVRVRTTSGMELLDEAALAHVQRFAMVPAPPEELDWVTREITLPVRYQTRRQR